MNTKHALLLATTGALLAIAPELAWSGYKVANPVTVNVAGSSASGSMGSARNSGDPRAQIGCFLYASGSSGSAAGGCMATTSDNTWGSCWFQNKPQLAAVVQSITPDSSIHFQWDASGVCTSLQVETSSKYEPKQP